MRTEMKRWWIIVVVLVTALALMAPAAATPNEHANPHAFTKTITVVSTNDFHGALVGRSHSWSHDDVVGGAAYLAGYLDIVRDENPGGFLYLDAGDAMQGTLISNYFEGASTIDVFNAMGVAAMTVGNHEFDWGQEVLAERVQQMHFPLLGANVVYEGTGERPDYLTPYVIKPVKGVKVGIIGVANPETPSITNPVNVADLEFTDPADAVEDLIDEMEAEGATMIIVDAHFGGFWPDFEEVKPFACSLQAAGLDDDIDLIVSGHTHSRIDDEICGIPVVQAYSSGTAFARVDFTVDKRTGEVVDYTMNSYPTTTYNTYYQDPATYKRWDTGVRQEVVPNAQVAGIVARYAAEVESIKNEVIGVTETAITRDYRHESAMGDWVTDIMVASDSGIDFAMTNSGGLRADIDAGPITFGEVFEAQPFDNTLVTVELSGAEVLEVLEEGITGAHGVVQVSGLQFTFDYDTTVGPRIVGDVVDLSTGLALVPGTTYTVAVNDFMANGGDDYETLAANPQVNSYVLVRDLVVDWVKANSPFAPPDPAVEQRITALGTPPS